MRKTFAAKHYKYVNAYIYATRRAPVAKVQAFTDFAPAHRDHQGPSRRGDMTHMSNRDQRGPRAERPVCAAAACV